jgi:4-amino-4-deoxy-L-arabinose transferase-like glycosyltransferase
MSERRGATRGDSRSLWLVLGVFAAAVVAINPVREVITDDDFAYALMVKHLAATGEYRLHDWAAANMPVQIYWARLLSGLFGFSFTTLRASTLILLTIAIVALYGVVRDRRASDAEAGLMTLVFLANPLVLFLGFTFMTDVQFLGWMTLALWCYLRALHGGSWRAMAAGAISAAAAVGTRQFGIALPAGLALTWLLDRDRRHSWGLYGLGVGPPAIAGLWQIFGGMTHPSFSQRLRLHEQAAYVGSLGNFILEAVWRPTVISQYLAVFLSPLVPVILWSVYRSWRRPERAPLLSGEPPAGSLSRTLLFAALTGYIAAGVMFGWLERGLLMPSLLFYFSRVLGPVLVFYLSSLPHSTSWIRVSVTL